MPRLDVSKVDVLVLLLVANSLSPVASSLPALPTLLLPLFLVGAESLMSGRRVKGREAIACDAAGAVDAAAGTRILIRRGRRLLRRRSAKRMSLIRSGAAHRQDGAAALPW